jgi:hypothetical protein
MRFPSARRGAVAALALLLLAACDDGPTAPTSYVQQTSGGAWVAVMEPVGLPRVETWMPYIEGGGAAAATLRDMRDRAARFRTAARVEEALQLEDEMMGFAARSLTRAPEPARMLAAIAALEQWTDRARARLETGSYPELEAAAATVSAHAEAARAALAAGDTNRAVLSVTRGAIAAREHAPLAVGLRLMSAVEARLAAGVVNDADARRARHLLADAREGLATGDSVRALRRAVYALQLLEAQGVAVPPPARTAVDSLRPLQ